MLKKITIDMYAEGVKREIKKADNEKKREAYTTLLQELEEVKDIIIDPEKVYMVSREFMEKLYAKSDFSSIIFMGRYVDIREICNFPGTSNRLVSITLPTK